MMGMAGEATAALQRLAVAVDADHGAHLFLDRGDGLVELAASVREGRLVASPAGEDGSHA